MVEKVQKNYKESWKNLPNSENLEIGTTWDPGTYVYQACVVLIRPTSTLVLPSLELSVS